jgi:hypothetical protein
LSRLAEATNRVLATAAVVGLEFEPAVVERAAGVGEDELLAAVEEATLARLLTEVPGARYRFGHALVRATLYDELTGARHEPERRRLAMNTTPIVSPGFGPCESESLAMRTASSSSS